MENAADAWSHRGNQATSDGGGGGDATLQKLDDYVSSTGECPGRAATPRSHRTHADVNMRPLATRAAVIRASLSEPRRFSFKRRPPAAAAAAAAARRNGRYRTRSTIVRFAAPRPARCFRGRTSVHKRGGRPSATQTKPTKPVRESVRAPRSLAAGQKHGASRGRTFIVATGTCGEYLMSWLGGMGGGAGVWVGGGGMGGGGV